ncbi:bifunctional metallophosphatase/5'-nucleotidase [Halorarum halobium]|uniref:bifunctional metallophosphatase/5'-nucleotidase n=1 Tax=Halorarum halobium TaxID=3075121 RepID=UPI0028A8FFD7|nr:bifunctional metallophosphatase/5'-nucleotidase [Halobaculum sp. XH14]
MVRLLHYSDVENVYDDPERAGRLAACIADLDGPDALVVGAGDDTAPGVLALVARGRQALDFFAAVDTAVETFGNHDFDFGPDATREIVADSPQTWVSANVYDDPDDEEPFAASEGVVPWTVETVGGVDVGFLGVTDPATDSLNPMAADLTFTDPYEAAARAATALRSAGVDHVVAVSHLGGGDDDLARRADVDLVLGGHVHTERVDRVDGVLCTRPGVNGGTVLEVEVTDDGASVRRHDPGEWPVNDRLADALGRRMESAGLDEVVGHAAEPIRRTEATIHGGESRIGNLVADAYRHAADADVGLQNSGGIRLGEELAGDVTLADLVSTIPFEEPIVTAEVTGAELRDAFRQMSAAVVDFGEPDWWHGHVSGARVVWDDAERELREARVDGESVDPDATYLVATPEYILHSDHEFPAIGQRHRAGEHGIQHEALAEYIRDAGLDPTVDGRITRVSTATEEDGTAATAGGESAETAATEPTEE